ncbi:type I inositol polyphosphate 5-phosphatase 10-like isoform X3 [Prunus avium]|uniref:Type I inositol polyphosphate 5-phosphatase 10-like isoform X3 n=1 Tax=Prunus avium TaxID=42229 RepID=A0A6P5RDN8_PRUAV|nr:type I inositol polyphosphate 5-phosphatase 10-like isoform X3 [Prunus avium]
MNPIDETVAVSKMTVGNQDVKKKSFIHKIFTMKERDGSGSSDFPEPQSNPAVDIQSISSTEPQMPAGQYVQSFRVFVATWNVGGKSPHNGLNLDDFLQVNNESDIYVLGFQEIVPLNAGNVLVLEDNEPAAKWLTLINQSLNKSLDGSSRSKASGSRFSSKPSLKKVSKTFRTESKRRLKSCNCIFELERKQSKDFCFRCQQPNINEDDLSSEPDEDGSNVFDISEISMASTSNHLKYSLIASKQMVGIFVTIWARKEHIQYVSHLRISCISRGIMGCLGNKGCISVSFLFHQTSFCFVCSHLASGEKEGDELRRNLDVLEILKSTQFPKICKTTHSRMPDKILGHDMVIWLGDLNYRIALSYSETRKLLENNDWDALLNKDQLKIEREAERVFKGWKEGKIYFAPTYKYFYNSDTYFGEIKTSKKKRRTPAWCDRILWHGNGIKQLSYIRGESRFSDHRPVCGTFVVDVVANHNELKKGSPSSNMKIEIEELLPTARYLKNMY